MAEGPPEQPLEEPPEEPEEPEEQPAEQPFGSYEQYLEAQVTPRDLYYLEVGAGSGQKGPGGCVGGVWRSRARLLRGGGLAKCCWARCLVSGNCPAPLSVSHLQVVRPLCAGKPPNWAEFSLKRSMGRGSRAHVCSRSSGSSEASLKLQVMARKPVV